MAIPNELLQGIIAVAIVTLVVLLCCLFYWCKVRKAKTEHNSILEDVHTERPKDTTDGRPRPKGNKSQEDQWRQQERRQRFQQIVSEHRRWEGQPQQFAPQIRHNKQLDLHHYTLKDAMLVFELFIAVSLDDYNETDLVLDRFIDVITGRGLHSKDGVPVIKMHVSDYLVKNCFTHTWPNPGMVRIDLYSKSQPTRPSQPNGQKSLRQIFTCNVV